MKCRKCGERAAVHMRQHRLALCKDHFLDWVPEQIQYHIEKYRMFNKESRLLAAVSGGKDSLSLWDILVRLGYQVDGLYICLGIDEGIRYSQESQRLSEAFAAQRGLKLWVVDVAKEHGETIPEMARRTSRGRDRPCAVCGTTKRHIMNRIARDGGYDTLVTGHNLDDEAAILFGNTMNWIPGYLVRQWPVLEANRPGVARKAKPLCRIYEREMAAYAILRGIEYIYNECPFSEGSKSLYYKEILNRMEDSHPGTKMYFYVMFLQAKKQGLFTPQADPDIDLLHTCPSCGQPTSAPEVCNFCRMVGQANSR